MPDVKALIYRPKEGAIFERPFQKERGAPLKYGHEPCSDRNRYAVIFSSLENLLAIAMIPLVLITQSIAESIVEMGFIPVDIEDVIIVIKPVESIELSQSA